MGIDRMALNNALETLTKTWDEKKAKLVVEFCSKFPKQKPLIYQSINRSSHDETTTGFTREQGNVTIHTSEPEETKETYYGVHKEKVGWFRVWKVREGILEFQHFWGSDLTTESINHENRPLKYRIEYDPNTLTPYFLSYWDSKDIFNLGMFVVSVEYPVSMYGKSKAHSFNVLIRC